MGRATAASSRSGPAEGARMLTLLAFCTVIAAAPPAPAQASPRPLRIAVAGLTHGHVHGLLGRRSADLEIVGIAEKDAALARRYAAQYGISEARLFPDLATLLDREHPDAVAADGQTSEHLEEVENCAPRRVPVMVEKPLATTGADAR